MIEISNINEFLINLLGVDKDEIKLDTDIFKDLGCTGDDFHEMIDKYSELFHVNMSSYLWYFHSDEEGLSIGSFFIKAPYEVVKRIPVTPKMLFEFAKKGKWDIEYPPHQIPKKRYDHLINLIIIVLFALFLIYYYLIR